MRTKTTGCLAIRALPDEACTPGAIIVTATVAQICVSGYSKSVRSVSSSEKSAVYAEYGITSHLTGAYEVDHLISLELGGSNDIANLWPEPAAPAPGFHQKDQVENELHSRVCAGKVKLADAQREIATNWLELLNSGVAASPDLIGDSALDVDEMTATAVVAVTPNPIAPTAGSVVPSTTPAEPATGGLSFISIVGGPPNAKASATVQTSPGTACSITYLTPSGTASTAQGLVPVTADASGRASWTWDIGPRTAPGKGSVTVKCNGASISSSITIG